VAIERFAIPSQSRGDRIVIDGYARWELARRIGRQMLNCFEYDLSPEEALEGADSNPLSISRLDGLRGIELALDLEPHLQKESTDESASRRPE
jgi:hypothetical protein